MNTYFYVISRPENRHASATTLSGLVVADNAVRTFALAQRECTYESAERMYGPLTAKPADGVITVFSLVEAVKQ